MNIKNAFLKIDQFIFNKLDQLKSDSSIQKLNDIILNLSDEQQKIFSQIIVFGAILIPYLIISIFLFMNYKVRNRIQQKVAVIEQVNLYKGNSRSLQSITDNYLNSNSIFSQGDLESRLINIASQYSIKPEKIQVINFDINNQSTSLSSISARIKFNNFGTNDFSNFMREIINTDKFKILSVDFLKNKEDHLLNGNIEISLLAKANPSY